MSHRAHALRPPLADLDLSEFPSAGVPQSGSLFRAHDAAHRNPWYFANDGGGRFNLAGSRGTCYIADSVETSVRERLGAVIVESQALEVDRARRMAVTTVSPAAQTTFAAVNDARAVRYGLTREIGTTSNYSVSRSWAAAFFEAGLGGVHYSSRFTTAAVVNSWAVFGPAGLGTDEVFEPLSRIDGVSACRAAGLRVLPSELDDLAIDVLPSPR